jgi:hypothetical protein
MAYLLIKPCPRRRQLSPKPAMAAGGTADDPRQRLRSLDVCCWQCHHRAILSADPWPDHVPVPAFGPRMVGTRCGIIGADARPNWREQPARESLTGAQWR